jgi:sugar/nucleoside kinase (ribokinase family)
MAPSATRHPGWLAADADSPVETSDGEGGLVFISNAPHDMEAVPVGEPVGVKHPVRFVSRLGGVGGNGALVAATNRLQAHLIAVQSRDEAESCRRLARESGLVPHFTERDGDEAARSVSYPDGDGGGHKLLVQRCRPITRDELTPNHGLLRRAGALVVGPMPTRGVAGKGDETVDLLKSLPALAPQAYLALEVHPDLVGDARFLEVAALYDYVQMNAAEAERLPVTGGLESRFAYLRNELGADKDFTVTNGGGRGLLSADGLILPVVPAVVPVVSDVGAGDVLCTAWVIARVFYRADAAAALAYALEATAATISRAGPIAPFPVPAAVA